MKKHDFLVCIDSDGCAMDTMDSKHISCFGPCLLPIWGLEAWQEEILVRWNEINLYTMTRGINRFKGLAILLMEVDSKWKTISGIETFVEWTEQAPELSSKSVDEQWKKTGNVIFKQAFEWSEMVNASIEKMPPETKKVFPGVREALKQIHAFADIAIVSSANHQAVVDEWERQELLPSVDMVMSQNMGSKSECIRFLLKNGYEKNHVLMMGDAPGDYQAAQENGVLFYPILVRKEAESWKIFASQIAEAFCTGAYEGELQKQMISQFKENLSK